MTSTFKGKVGVQQRVLPRYRVPFFEDLALRCPDGLEVFAGAPRPDEQIVTDDQLTTASRVEARNVHISRGRFYLCWQRAYRRWLHEYEPDALIVAADPRMLTNYLAIRHMKSRRRPIVGWGLGTLNPRNSGVMSLVSQIRSRLYRSFDALIAYSSKAAEDYLQAGVREESIFVAHNAVSTTNADMARVRFPSDGREVREWRASHGLTGPTVICVGRLIPEKRMSVLIEACRALGDDCELLIVGDGPDRNEMEGVAADRFPRARFLGHQEGDALSLAFASSDLFVLPGTGGLAIYEAMAHGKPVIVGEGDGTESDLVREGRNGCLVTPGDVAALTKAIRTYVRDPHLIKSAGQESVKIVRDEVSISRMSSTFIQALHVAEATSGREGARP